MTRAPAKVFLVGSGPGDPGLMTLRGCQALAQADLVLYDYLVNPQILAHARPEAELVCRGRHGQGPLMTQQEINRRLVEAAQAGRVVVRLKAGDPVVFAHAAEEIAVLEAQRIPYEIVPGITAALAVGSYAGIPLTQGDAASAVALVAGQERDDKAAHSLDYAALAGFPGTLVFYMGVTTAEHWTAALILAGKSPATPAAIVRRCSWPDQLTIACTLGTVAEEIRARRLRPPALVVVGPVAARVAARGWFVERPLFGRRVLVTRAVGQSAPLAAALAELGAAVIEQPVIEIGPPLDWGPVDHAIQTLDRFDWLVFTSANGVQAFMDRLLATHDVRALGRARLAAVGPGTAEALARYHLRADLVPAVYRSEDLADALVGAAAGRQFLLPRADRGREVLSQRLAAAGGQVTQVVAYSSRDLNQLSPELLTQLEGGQVDWITVTSPAIARALVSLAGSRLARSRLASISPLTSTTLAELGQHVAAQSAAATTDALVEALLLAERPHG